MRLTPREPVIPEDGGFTDANDIFGYREFAENLSNLVQDIDEPLVIVLDGPWGSGKSTFVKQWAGLLRAKDAPVIVFDAFANDHHEDAFLGISAEIHDTAKKVLGSGAGATRRYFDKAKRAGALLAPIGLRVTARVATAGLMSIDDIEAGGEALKEAAKAFGDEGGKALEKAVSERLRSAGRERAILQTFRESLSELARNVSEKRSKTCRTYPLVFFIDELDRCRPPFALSVIERVKHLFSVPGVCFVLVAHVGQLEKIVEGAYGTGFDARTYLEKFYHLMIALPEGTSRQAANRTAYISHLWDALEIRFLLTHTDELVKQQLTDFAEVYDLSLRRMERIMSHVALAAAAAGPRRLVIAPLLVGLCVMRQSHPHLYKKALRGELSWPEAHEFLTPTGRQEIDEKDWAQGFWRYATDAPMDAGELNKFEQGLFQYNVRSRNSLLPFTANYIEAFVNRRDEASSG